MWVADRWMYHNTMPRDTATIHPYINVQGPSDVIDRLDIRCQSDNFHLDVNLYSPSSPKN